MNRIGMKTRESRASGQMKVMGGSPSPLLAQSRKADDGRDQVIAGGQGQLVHPRALEGLMQLLLAILRSLLETLAETRIMRVDVELLAGLGILHDDRADVGQLRLGRVGEPHGQ